MYLLLGLITVTLCVGLQEISPSVLTSRRHYCSGSCIVGYVAIVVMLEGTNLTADFWSFGPNLSFPSSRMFPKP